MTTTGRARAKRAGYHHGDLRRALLEASLTLVEEAGIGALSLREVARKAGVSHNAPYHHFKDRGSLLAALADEGFAQLAAEMAAARAAAPDARARLQACGLAYVRFALKSAARFKLMFRPELSAPSEGTPARASTSPLDVLTAAIVETQQAGLAPPGDPMPLVLTCWSAVHGLASLWLDGPLARTQRAFGASSPDALATTMTSTLATLIIGAAGAGDRPRRAR